MVDNSTLKKSQSNFPRNKLSTPLTNSWVLHNIDIDNELDSQKKHYSVLEKNFVKIIARPSLLTTSIYNSKLASVDEKSVQAEPKTKRSKSVLRVKRSVLEEKIPSLKEYQSFQVSKQSSKFINFGGLHKKKLSEGKVLLSRPSVNGLFGQDEFEKSPSHVRRSGFTVIQLLTKKYLTAQKIVQEYELDEKSKVVEEDQKNHSGNEEDEYRSYKKQRSPSNFLPVDLKHEINNLVEILDNCIKDMKFKQKLYKHLEKAAEIALCSRNGQLYMAVLKTQAKCILLHNDIYKALNTFKVLKKTAEAKKDHMTRLIGYKYIGRCFHMIGNHTMAVFYYTKLLQMAWYCDQSAYELKAYDLIGLEYYYLGDLVRANFYHNKMAECRVEAKDSDLKKLGISKLLIKMNEYNIGQKKDRQGFVFGRKHTDDGLPQSEDDFELPPPDNQSRNKDSNDGGGSIGGRDSSPPKREVYELKRILLKKKGEIERTWSRRSTIRPRTHDKDPESVEQQQEDKGILEETSKKHLFLSHLSPNRLPKNFNLKDTKDAVSDYVGKSNGEERNMITLDNKTVIKLKSYLFKLKSNLELALKRIIELERNRWLATAMIK